MAAIPGINPSLLEIVEDNDDANLPSNFAALVPPSDTMLWQTVCTSGRS